MAYDFSKLDANIKESEEWLTRELSGIRTGRASAALLDTVRPEVYGARTPLQQLASVAVEDARTIRITPWDKSNGKDIERAITEADLGVSVSTDDIGLRIIFPDLTAERRQLLIKMAGERTEHAKITLRGHRNEAIKQLEADEKEGGMGKDEVARYKEEIQKKIDAGVASFEASFKKKQEEIAI